jgi:CheY-like chemotaxis protein
MRGSVEILRSRLNLSKTDERLLDIMIPDLNGFQFLSLLRKDTLDQGARRVLVHVRQILAKVHDRDTLLGELVDLMIDLMGMERALVFLRDSKTGHLRLAKGRNIRMVVAKAGNGKRYRE